MPTLAQNKESKYNYDLLETYEAGLELLGSEVKSIRAGNVSLKGSFLSGHRGELWLKGMHVGPYAPAGEHNPKNPQRDRRVLVRKSEINRLRSKHESERLTIVPISLYTKGGLIKLKFALARGKKQYEKRATIKRRELDREIQSRLRS